MSEQRKARRYSEITAHPNTPQECARIDALARKVDERWELERAARARMDDASAERFASEHGWEARRSQSCARSKTRRATRIRVSCQVWTKVGTYTIPGLGSGRSLADAVYAPTWEEAFRLAACKVKLRELDRRAHEQEGERERATERRRWNRRRGPRA